MNIEQITDKYLDKLYKIDPLDDFMWKKKELVEFAGFVLESMVPEKDKCEICSDKGWYESSWGKMHCDCPNVNDGKNKCIDQIRQKAGLI